DVKTMTGAHPSGITNRHRTLTALNSKLYQNPESGPDRYNPGRSMLLETSHHRMRPASKVVVPNCYLAPTRALPWAYGSITTTNYWPILQSVRHWPSALTAKTLPQPSTPRGPRRPPASCHLPPRVTQTYLTR